MTPTYERITANDVEVGDEIARAKTHQFAEVVEISEGPVARRFLFGRGSIRPRRTAKLWRRTDA